ncbi:hypothetical protein Ahy_B05g073982 isoform D [Arachis hypogaea]|uniref:Uncharacterized protein n=1 Tax=Arachis hypogaea TaxID=3818 RepID=A0A444YXL3_ARAHY|nr:hypothetical protein Ahy_B05g073982 isoform D [Arachis hypogaea]
MSFDPLLLFLLSFDSLLVELLSLLIELRSSTPLLIELRSSLLVFITAGYCSIITARVFCEILVFGILMQIEDRTSFTIGIIAKTTELQKPWQLEWETSNKGLKKWSGDGKNRVPLFLHSSIPPSQSKNKNGSKRDVFLQQGVCFYTIILMIIVIGAIRLILWTLWLYSVIVTALPLPLNGLNKTVSLFETTIRVLGGLLSAHLIVNDYATSSDSNI